MHAELNIPDGLRGSYLYLGVMERCERGMRVMCMEREEQREAACEGRCSRGSRFDGAAEACREGRVCEQNGSTASVSFRPHRASLELQQLRCCKHASS